MDNQEIIERLRNFLDEANRLKQYPANKSLKKIALIYLSTKFEENRKYTEMEVNDILKKWHTFNDHSMLRRDLYERRFLGREKDGSFYWLCEEQPTIVSLGLEHLYDKK